MHFSLLGKQPQSCSNITGPSSLHCPRSATPRVSLISLIGLEIGGLPPRVWWWTSTCPSHNTHQTKTSPSAFSKPDSSIPLVNFVSRIHLGRSPSVFTVSLSHAAVRPVQSTNRGPFATNHCRPPPLNRVDCEILPRKKQPAQLPWDML